MSKGAQVGGAFVAGGLLGLAVEAMRQLCMAVIPDDAMFGSAPLDNFAAAIGLIILVIPVFIMYITGLWDKFERWGGFGTILPLLGLLPAVGNIAIGVQSSGAPRSVGVKVGVTSLLKMLGTGYGILVIVSFIVESFKANVILPNLPPPVTGLISPELPAQIWLSPGMETDPLELFPGSFFVLGFIVAGAIGAILQIALIVLKKTPQEVFPILLVAMILGMATPITHLLNSVAPGGFTVQLMGGGEMIYSSAGFGFNLGLWDVTIARLILYPILVAVYLTFGVIGSKIRINKHPEMVAPPVKAAEPNA